MARSKRSKQSTRSRQVKRELQILRKKGLIGRGEYRGKPGGSAYRITSKYKDVIQGKAVAVKPKTRLVTKRMKKQFRERRGKIVVPKPKGTVSTRVVRRGGKTEILRTRQDPLRGKVRELVGNFDNIPPLKPGQRYRLTMPNWGGTRAMYFDSNRQFQKFAQEYKKRKGFEEWADIAVIEKSDLPEEYDQDEVA